jgi:hypothetical protein
MASSGEPSAREHVSLTRSSPIINGRGLGTAAAALRFGLPLVEALGLWRPGLRSAALARAGSQSWFRTRHWG